MSSKTKKHPKVAAAAASHAAGAWRPHIETDPLFNPFASTGVTGDGRTQFGENGEVSANLRDASEDSAPLQGTKDLSDVDSLQDVLATAALTPRPATRRRPLSSTERRSSAAKARPASDPSHARHATKAKRGSRRKSAKSTSKARDVARVQRRTSVHHGPLSARSARVAKRR